MPATIQQFAPPEADSSSLARRPDGDLLKVEQARELLAECARVDDAKQIRDQAHAIRVYLRQQNASREAQNSAAEIKLRAERRLGELLEPDREKRGGAKCHRVTLPEGVSRRQSSCWQEVARVPAPLFEAYIAGTKTSEDGELTANGLMRTAARAEAEAAAIAGKTAEKQLDEQIRRGIEKIESFEIAVEMLKQGYELVEKSYLLLRDLDPGLFAKVSKAFDALAVALRLASLREWQFAEYRKHNSPPPAAAPEQPEESR